MPSTTLTANDLARAQLSNLTRPKVLVTMFAVVVVSAAIGVALRAPLVALGGTMFVALLPFTMWVQSRQLKKTLPKGPTTWLITDEGLDVRNDISDGVVKWDAFTALRETRSAVYLRRDALMFVIPSRAFSSADERAASYARSATRPGCRPTERPAGGPRLIGDRLTRSPSSLCQGRRTGRRPVAGSPGRLSGVQRIQRPERGRPPGNGT